MHAAAMARLDVPRVYRRLLGSRHRQLHRHPRVTVLPVLVEPRGASGQMSGGWPLDRYSPSRPTAVACCTASLREETPSFR